VIISALPRRIVLDGKQGTSTLSPPEGGGSQSHFTGQWTFEIKTLRTMIELQAHWTDEDLKRLKLIE